MDAVEQWIESSGYSRRLGVQVDALGDDRVRLVLPFLEENTNPGNVLHGGVAASMIAIAGQAATRAALGPEAAPFHSSGLQVTYLAAAREEAIVAEARLLRRGKELCFVDVSVESESGKPIAHGLVTGRGRLGAEPGETPTAVGDAGGADPGPMGRHVVKTPFMARLGLRVEHMQEGRSRIVLPGTGDNADAGGGAHEGAVLALLDTTGAMAAWAVTGPGRFKASTPALQAQVLTPPPAGDLVAYGHSLHRDREAFWADVEVAAPATGHLVARGTVLYRIVQ
ncbi:MAG: hotdog fold thioesterase [Myxococcota bacterium]|nr:hotdog fold thioesterase [Myxococcota bacterium]